MEFHLPNVILVCQKAFCFLGFLRAFLLLSSPVSFTIGLPTPAYVFLSRLQYLAFWTDLSSSVFLSILVCRDQSTANMFFMDLPHKNP